MSRHRLEPPPRVRPRVGRIAAAVVSMVVTGIALLGGIGVIPLGGAGRAADHAATTAAKGTTAVTGTGSGAFSSSTTPRTTTSTTPTPTAPRTSTTPSPKASPNASARLAASTSLPTGSGAGRRVVFSMHDQRVWLVDDQGRPFSTYLVSGSLTDNLHPGDYHVYSRSRWAVGVEDSGVMQYFVRFTRGNNAAIGFHSIPTKNGKPLQTERQLGTPQSHGCIRQKLGDAVRMWDFAHTGTEVVVVA
jgi:hypothetical protein